MVSIRDEIANLLDLTASHHLYLCKHAKLVLHNSQGQILCGHRDNDEWLDHRFSQFPNKHIVTQCQNRFPSATPPDTSETADTTSVVSSHYNRTLFTSQPLFRSIKLVVHTHKVPNNVATESIHGVMEDHLLQRPRSLLRFVPQVETHCRIHCRRSRQIRNSTSQRPQSLQRGAASDVLVESASFREATLDSCQHSIDELGEEGTIVALQRLQIHRFELSDAGHVAIHRVDAKSEKVERSV